LIMTLLLVFGCEGLQPAQEAVITLDSEQKTEISLSSDGGAFDVSFTSALDWTAEIVYVSGGEGWASLNLTSGKGGYSIARLKVNVQKNGESDPRSAKVVITSGAKKAEVSFTQDEDKGFLPGPNPDLVFRLTEKSAEVPAEGAVVEVTVEYNVEYYCEVSADWIKEVESKSYDQKVHVFEVQSNDSEEPRNTTISFCGNGTCIPFKVEQAGGVTEYRLEVDAKTISVEAAGTASPIKVNVTSNVQWNVASDAEWCSVSPASGENNGSFAVTASENTSYDARMANITVVSSVGTVSKNIAVIQSPARQESGDDAWKTAEFYHRSLAFRFTADWCPYCPMMATAMSNAQKQLPGKLEVISVHGSGSGLACETSNTITENYPISGYPTGLIDGWIYVRNENQIAATTSKIIAAINDTEATYDTYSGTSWTSSVSGSQVTLNLAAYIKKAGSYKVSALLVEDNVIGYQSDNENSLSYNYNHRGIIRVALSEATGEPFEISYDGQIKNFTYTATLPSVCNVANVRVVVYIQRYDVSKNSYYVDNSASAKVGESQDLEVTSGSWSDGNEGIVPGDDINL